MRLIGQIGEWFDRRLQLAAPIREAAEHPVPSDDSVAPERWGDLLLLERLGTGAHAEVYRAWDPGLHREVALKLVLPNVEDSALLDEGRVAARVRHPHVVTIHWKTSPFSPPGRKPSSRP